MSIEKYKLEISEAIWKKKVGVSIPGRDLSEKEVLALLEENYPNMAYCVVRDWVYVEVDHDEDQRKRLSELGLLPTLMYAHEVVFDSQHRFPIGGPVRTSLLRELASCVLFRTRSTVYVLVGGGRRVSLSMGAVAYFMSQ